LGCGSRDGIGQWVHESQWNSPSSQQEEIGAWESWENWKGVIVLIVYSVQDDMGYEMCTNRKYTEKYKQEVFKYYYYLY
jgi:hypothetical protein